jgi:hypothetical protein
LLTYGRGRGRVTIHHDGARIDAPQQGSLT